jgi:hypothetical protein
LSAHVVHTSLEVEHTSQFLLTLSKHATHVASAPTTDLKYLGAQVEQTVPLVQVKQLAEHTEHKLAAVL